MQEHTHRENIQFCINYRKQ
uniref:Uncharacterized protein n=1 Tax=Rhizophora mucronata TaxID=61149 RepID=A0A2P2P7W0_RHIMU